MDEKDAFYYPDVLVSCESRDRETYYREHSCLVIEVLSPSTERTDRFEKFMFYRHLDSLGEYVLVSQDYRQVEIYRRSGGWEPVRYDRGVVTLESVQIEITIDQIYRRTDR